MTGKQQIQWVDWRNLPCWAKTLLVLSAVAFACVLPEFAFLIDLGGLDLAISFLLASLSALSIRLQRYWWQAAQTWRLLLQGLRASWLGHPGGCGLALLSGLLGLFWLANHWALLLAMWPALWPRL